MLWPVRQFIRSRFHHFYLAMIIIIIAGFKSIKAILLPETAEISLPNIWHQNAANSLTTKLWQMESK